MHINISQDIQLAIAAVIIAFLLGSVLMTLARRSQPSRTSDGAGCGAAILITILVLFVAIILAYFGKLPLPK